MVIREDIYRHITEKASDIFYTVSLDSKITFHNKAIENIFEVPIEEIEKKHYDYYMLPKDKELAKKLHDERLQGKSSVFEHGFKTPNGKLIYLEISATPIFNDEGEITGSFGIARDITEKRMAQEKLKESKLELEDLIKIKDKFLSIIAHDLKDPFNILIGYSDLILTQLEEINKDKIKEYIQAINTSSNNAYNLLSNLLDWFKTESKRISCKPVNLDLCKVLGHTISAINYAASGKNIKIKITCRENLNVNVDENMLRTVLRNLISNAIKFSFENNEINIKVIEEEKQTIISITDTGIGIKKEDLHKLFTKNFNESVTGTYNEKGTGLGLKICREFVTKWDGKIWAESVYGRGSTFSFSIPK